ncbi:ABC1 family protein [Amycolatopsis xylanica]|uniref:ABC1 family protein n=1 Tax=Amycolatopsis xylanica TaxID=589385 RepID=A0A1H3SSS2_9PSEU|nr:AarF/ABC1/UbiB kinase family protein [Amycolatopsis xylanica]SDZ40159.1 ABC1 family protein [Amycolatopsis xylanica]
MPSEIPTSRFARTGRLGVFAAGQAARQMGTKASTLGRSEPERTRILERRALEAADQIVNMLGSMKGAAMKLGQMLSVIDIGIVPEDARADFQRKLAALRDQAPPVSFSGMRSVIESDLGKPLGDAFAKFDETPIAAASIGQVYRAELADGRVVAVKVQYPGIATAVRADLKNLALFLRFSKKLLPGLEAGPMTDEISTRIIEELDYRREAETQAEVAAAFRGHPFIVVPDSVPELCGEHVLVTEFVEGAGFAEIQREPQDVRDRVAEIAYRFYCGSLYRKHRFPGDPHPGNLLLCPDGRVAFLDFGLFKTMPEEDVHVELEVLRAASEGRARDVHALLDGIGVFPDPDLIEPDVMLAYIRDAVGWYLDDEEIAVTPELATDAFIASIDPRSAHFRKLRWQHLPPAHLFARRVELYTFGLLGQLYARGNWHRIAREWLYGEAPVTPLGKLEEGWQSPD